MVFFFPLFFPQNEALDAKLIWKINIKFHHFFSVVSLEFNNATKFLSFNLILKLLTIPKISTQRYPLFNNRSFINAMQEWKWLIIVNAMGNQIEKKNSWYNTSEIPPTHQRPPFQKKNVKLQLLKSGKKNKQTSKTNKKKAKKNQKRTLKPYILKTSTRS